MTLHALGASRADDTERSSAGAHRFALVSSWRWVVPAAIAFGLVSSAWVPPSSGRLLLLGGALILGLLWWLRPRVVLIVDDRGYRVCSGGRERLRVAFAEVRRVRAVPNERAMYIDCGDAARNLLLPPRRGYGFSFEHQTELYTLLARALDDRLEIAATLAAAPGVSAS